MSFGFLLSCSSVGANTSRLNMKIEQGLRFDCQLPSVINSFVFLINYLVQKTSSFCPKPSELTPENVKLIIKIVDKNNNFIFCGRIVIISALQPCVRPDGCRYSDYIISFVVLSFYLCELLLVSYPLNTACRNSTLTFFHL